MKMKLAPWLAFLHKWIGLIIGIQIVLWMCGGLVMSVFPIETVRGEHNIREQDPVFLTASDLATPLAPILAEFAPDGVEAVTAKTLLGRPVYDLDRTIGGHLLVDARTGGALSIDEGVVRALARADFAGEAPIEEIALIHETNVEYRGPTPAWRVRFSDEESTRLYFLPDSGRLVARRNDTWRLYDFFWMLHIMDYENRTDFNNPLVITAAAFALFTVLMGFGLMFFRLRFKDWRVMFARRPRG